MVMEDSILVVVHQEGDHLVVVLLEVEVDLLEAEELLEDFKAT